MKMPGKIVRVLVLFFFFCDHSFSQPVKDTLNPAKKPVRQFNTYNFMPFVANVLKLKVDSLYFTKSGFTPKKKYPVFKKENVAKVIGFSHCSESELKPVNPENPNDHLFLITDSLAIVNTSRCPPNKVELPAGETDSILNVFKNKKMFQKIPGGGSSCFFPRHTLLFLDKKDLVIAYIEICFQCDMVLTSPNLKNSCEGNFIGDGEKKLKELFFKNKINVTGQN